MQASNQRCNQCNWLVLPGNMMQGCVGDSALIVGQERTLKYEHNKRWTRRCFKTTSNSSSKFIKKKGQLIESQYISQVARSHQSFTDSRTLSALQPETRTISGCWEAKVQLHPQVEPNTSCLQELPTTRTNRTIGN